MSQGCLFCQVAVDDRSLSSILAAEFPVELSRGHGGLNVLRRASSVEVSGSRADGKGGTGSCAPVLLSTAPVEPVEADCMRLVGVLRASARVAPVEHLSSSTCRVPLGRGCL